MLEKSFNTLFQYPPGGPPPPSMQEGYCLGDRVNEIDRDAVGDGDVEHFSRDIGRVTVHPIDQRPPPARGTIMPKDPSLVNLVAEDVGGELGLGVPQLPPPPHHLLDWLIGPESQIERFLPCPTTGDSGDDPVPFAPFRNFEPGYPPSYFAFGDVVHQGGL